MSKISLNINELIQNIPDQKDAINEILMIYGKIDIATISEKGRIILHQNIKDVNKVNLNRLKAFEAKGEGIYFRPTQKDKHDTIFLDDVPLQTAIKLAGATIVLTSLNKFQAHIKLDDTVIESDAKMLQYTLCNSTESDRGCSGDIYHFRRLPGFINQKYADRPIVNIIAKTEGLMSADKLKKNVVKQQEIRRAVKIKAKKHTQNIKTWNDFQDSDLSVSDMRYAVYLAAKGYTENTIKNKLLDESIDITLRHKNINDYLSRTINKAVQYVLVRHKPLRRGGVIYKVKY